MSEAATNGSANFSSKEMLVRLDGKVDSLIQTVASKNAYYDVEVALLKARAEKLEAEAKERDVAIEETRERQDADRTRINITSGAIALIVFLSPLLWILVNKLVGS